MCYPATSPHQRCRLPIHSSRHGVELRPKRLGLSREMTTFVGRMRERARLTEDLERGLGLLTITGPSGMGKTRLARTVGAALAPSFEDEGGVWFCSLLSCSNALDVEATVARELGLMEWTQGALGLALEQRGRTLLILDNGEWIASELGDLLVSWLERCVPLQILVTSIVPLDVEGEARLELGPLEIADAVSLYQERARRAAAGRERSTAELPIIEDLVCRLDRIPLAIELAAARVLVFPPGELLAHLDRRLQLLRSGTGGRHASLDEALALTWELLSPKERTVLARATVFAGGFTYEATLPILLEEAREQEMLDLLEGLRSKALLQIHEGESTRFSLLESIHAFAAQRLEEEGGADELLRRHAAWFVEHGEQEVARFAGPQFNEAVRSLQAERSNLEQAFRRNVATHPALAARAGLVLGALANESSYPPAEFPLFEATVEAARSAGEPMLLVRALVNRAYAHAMGNQMKAFEADNDEVLRLLRSSGGDPQAELSLLLGRQVLLVTKGIGPDTDRNLEAIERAALACPDPLSEASALFARITHLLEIERVEEAEASLERVWALIRQHGLKKFEAQASRFQAGSKYLRGRFREARNAVLSSLDQSRAVGNLHLESAAQMSLAMIEMDAGRPDEAERAALGALRFFREVANRGAEAFSLSILGILMLKRGDWRGAEGYLVEAVGILEQIGDRRRWARVLPYLAVVEARSGRIVEAEQSLRDAGLLLSEIDSPSGTLVAKVLEGHLDLARARSVVSTDLVQAEELVARVRARVAIARDEGGNRFLSDAVDLLVVDLKEWDADFGTIDAGQGNALRLAVDGKWFELFGGPRVDLQRRANLRRILVALAEQRLQAPGAGIKAHDLFAIGWPGESVLPDTALKRVYIGIWTLRGLGLAPVLLSSADGYLLDPAVPFLRTAES